MCTTSYMGNNLMVLFLKLHTVIFWYWHQISIKFTWTHLLRSKSCERPKMRDTFRMDKFAANFNRISSNITDKLLSSTSHISSSSNKPEYNHHHHNSSKDSHNTSEDSCREIDPVSPNNSLLQSVAFRAIPCVDIQVSKNKQTIIWKIIISSLFVVPTIN